MLKIAGDSPKEAGGNVIVPVCAEAGKGEEERVQGPSYVSSATLMKCYLAT